MKLQVKYPKLVCYSMILAHQHCRKPPFLVLSGFDPTTYMYSNIGHDGLLSHDAALCLAQSSKRWHIDNYYVEMSNMSLS